MKQDYRFIMLLAGSLLCIPALAEPPQSVPRPEVNEAQRRAFMNDSLNGVDSGSVITYDFARRGSGAEPIADSVELRVTAVQADGRRDLEFNFLTGPNHVDFHPAKAFKGNPVTIHFLERDIREMIHRTGGNSGYLRNRIRQSFASPEIHPVRIEVDGRTIDATAITLTPFVDDPKAEDLRIFKNKRYELMYSDALPGGLYRIHTLVPDDTGENALIEETLTFRDLSPATPPGTRD